MIMCVAHPYTVLAGVVGFTAGFAFTLGYMVGRAGINWLIRESVDS